MNRATAAGLAIVALLMTATGNQTYAQQDVPNNPVTLNPWVAPAGVNAKITTLAIKFDMDTHNFIGIAKTLANRSDSQSALLYEICSSSIDTASRANDYLRATVVEINLYKIMDPTSQAKAKPYLLSEIKYTRSLLVGGSEKTNDFNLATPGVSQNIDLFDNLETMKTDIRDAEDLLKSDDILK